MLKAVTVGKQPLKMAVGGKCFTICPTSDRGTLGWDSTPQANAAHPFGFFFLSREVSLSWTDWSQTHHVAQAGFEPAILLP